jgi:hypothetical protein
MSLGWSWEDAREQLDIPRINALQSYWRTNPPTHVLVKAYMRYKPDASLDAPSGDAPAAQTADIVDMLITPDTHG